MTWVIIVRFLHFLGFAAGFGASVAALVIFARAARSTGEARNALETAAADAVTKVELPAAFLALFGGIGLLVAFPHHLRPAESGAGPWMHIKLTLVLVALVVAHLRMFNLAKLGRARSTSAPESETAPRVAKGRTLGVVDVLLWSAVFFIALFRTVLFGS